MIEPIYVSAGARRSCALLASDTVQCWGANAEDGSGAISITTVAPQSETDLRANADCNVSDGTFSCWGIPAPADFPADPLLISAGGNHACAVNSESMVCYTQDGRTIKRPVEYNDGESNTDIESTVTETAAEKPTAQPEQGAAQAAEGQETQTAASGGGALPKSFALMLFLLLLRVNFVRHSKQTRHSYYS